MIATVLLRYTYRSDATRSWFDFFGGRCFRSAPDQNIDDGKIGAGRLKKVRDGSSIARHHRSRADDGHGGDRSVNDVGAACLGEDPTDLQLSANRAVSETLAGRIERHTLWPLSQGEIERRPETFLGRRSMAT